VLIAYRPISYGSGIKNCSIHTTATAVEAADNVNDDTSWSDDTFAHSGHLLLISMGNGVGTNFGVGVEEAKPEGPRAGNGVLGEGKSSPSPPTRGFSGAL